jgi:hypothetical protein
MAVGEAVGEILAEVLGSFLIKMPGAGVRWIFLRKKRNFHSILKDEWVNSITTVVLVAAIIAFTSFVL